MTPDETNGMSNKDLLLEQRGLLFHLTDKVDILMRDVAVHIALPTHPGSAPRLDRIEEEQVSQRAYINKALGIVGILVAVGLPVALFLAGK